MIKETQLDGKCNDLLLCNKLSVARYNVDELWHEVAALVAS